MDLEIFKNKHLGEVRSILDNKGQPWFVAKDVAEILEYKNPQKAIRDHIEKEDTRGERIVTPSGKQEMTIISESGLYSLILRSNKPKAKEFTKWVTKEVLPTIRQHGAYITKDKLKEINKDPAKQNELIKELQAKANLYDLENDKTNLTSVGEFAKILLNDIGMDIGRTRLYKFLKDNELVFKESTEPTQKAINLGYLQAKKEWVSFGKGRGTYKISSYFTPKGKIKLKDKIIKTFKGEIK